MTAQTGYLIAAILAAATPLGQSSAREDDPLVRRDPIATAAEVEAAREWARKRLLGPAAAAPFSFVYDEDPSGELLGSWKRTQSSRELDARRVEHTISYEDPVTGLVCTCTAIELLDSSAVEWLLRMENVGASPTPLLEHVEAADFGVARSEPATFTLHHSLGDSNSKDSFRPVVDVIRPGASAKFAPGGGRSSNHHLPFFNLDWRTGGMALAVGWSGEWEATFSAENEGELRVRAGMQHTRLRLRPGESIRTPRILVTFWEGTDPIRGNHVLRRTLMEHYSPRRGGRLVPAPVCASVNEVEPDGSYEGPHLRVLAPLARRGIEVFWSDMDPQQWYPGGFPTGTGNWEVDAAKYPRGLGPIGEAARAVGLEYLLWFEPERVHFGTRIDREKPEWVMKPSGEWSQLFALHLPEARSWLTDLVDQHVTEAKLEWIRWDFNIDPLGFWRRADAPDREGMTEIGYVEGLYAMWDDLMTGHPGLIIDQCASGGRRLDLESLSRGIPLWHSDRQCAGPDPAADQLQNAGLWRWLPMHGCGNFALEPKYPFRSAMTTGNILCIGDERGLLSTAAPETETAVERTVAVYKASRPYLIGDFYPLLPHEAAEDVWFAYQFHRPDLRAGMVMAFRRGACSQESIRLALHGITSDATYRIRDHDTGNCTEASGGDLAGEGLLVPITDRPGSAILFYEAR